MKILNFSLVALTSLVLMKPALANGPIDLHQLSERWHQVEKTHSADTLMSMETTYVDADDDIYERIRAEMENLGNRDRTRRIVSFQFGSLENTPKDAFLDKLFPKGQKDRAFCDAFALPTPKSKKPGTKELSTNLKPELSEAEKAEKAAKAKFSNCQAQVKSMVGTSNRLNPVYMGEVTYDDGESFSMFYVASIVEQNSYTRYHFKHTHKN